MGSTLQDVSDGSTLNDSVFLDIYTVHQVALLSDETYWYSLWFLHLRDLILGVLHKRDRGIIMNSLV